MTRPALFLALLLVPATVVGQESPLPPTADDRAIYAAAVDSTVFPDESDYVLLEDGRVRIEADGSHQVRTRVVRQVLRGAAAERAAELSFGYDPTRQSFELHWARVVTGAGAVIHPEPVHVQEGDAPAARNAPVYTRRKVVRVTLGSVEPGQIVDVAYTLGTHDPPMPDAVAEDWTVNGLGPIRETRFTVDAPAELALHVDERNLPSPGAVREEGGRRIHSWRYTQVEPYDPEPFATTDNDVAQTIAVWSVMGWDDIAAWYADLSRDRYAVGPELEARLSELVEGARTLEDSLRAVHRWVAQDIRYVSLSLGIGGYQPRTAMETFETGVGDCKDKTTLFLALARHMGVEGYPVLVDTDPLPLRVDRPSIRPFDHMIAAIRPGDEWIHLDLTVPVAPYDDLYGGLEGKRGVLLEDGGRARIVEFATSEAGANRSSILIEGAVAEDGSFDGTYTERVTGNLQYRIRGEFSRPLTDRVREALARNLALRVAEGLTADSVEAFDGRDLEVNPGLRARVRGPGFLEELPGGWMLPLRLQRYGSEALVARLETSGERRFPIDVEKVFGRREHVTEYRLRLPEGWRARLPDAVRLDGPFGVYESVYLQEGRMLTVRRSLRGRDGVLPPERGAELVEWLRALHDDDVKFLIVEPPVGGAGG